MLASTTAAYAHHRDYQSYSRMYPSATPRQLQNLRGYERNEYYEHDSNAVPFGSRVWWEQAERGAVGRYRSSFHAPSHTCVMG
jgi:hypothetical protein